MRTALLTILILSAAGTAQAAEKYNKPAPIEPHGPPQVVAPGTPPSATVVVGGPAAEKSGPGANRTIANSGTGADTVMTDPAVGGNAGHPSRGVPHEGAAGGGAGQ